MKSIGDIVKNLPAQYKKALLLLALAGMYGCATTIRDLPQNPQRQASLQRQVEYLKSQTKDPRNYASSRGKDGRREIANYQLFKSLAEAYNK